MKITRHAQQQKLFDIGAELPNGLIYRPDFLTESEEEVLLAYLQNLPLCHPRYKNEYEAKRRHVGFGWGWDYEKERLIPGEPLPPFLRGAQHKIAKWLQLAPGQVAEALVNEYTPGSAIGWHVDNEGFERIVGLSLGGWARMRFRPLRKKFQREPQEIVALELEPRSAYIMQGDVRWRWQHSVAPVSVLRYSITFRTLPPGVAFKRSSYSR